MPMRKKLLGNGLDLMALVNNPEFREEIECAIGQEELMEALQNISKSVSEKDLIGYVKWAEEFKSL